MSTLSIPHDAVTLTTISSANQVANNAAIEAWANGNIDDANLLNGGITGSDKLKSNTVTQGVMALLSIGTPELIALACTTAKIAPDAIDQSKIADDAVEIEHVKDGEIQLAQTDPFSTNPTLTGTWATIDTCTAFTGLAKPVLILWNPLFKTTTGVGGNSGFDVRLQRQVGGGGWTTLFTLTDIFHVAAASFESNDHGNFIYLDTPAAGSVEYRFQAQETSGIDAGATITVQKTRYMIVSQFKVAA